jgi:hypothetical protein
MAAMTRLLCLFPVGAWSIGDVIELEDADAVETLLRSGACRHAPTSYQADTKSDEAAADLGEPVTAADMVAVTAADLADAPLPIEVPDGIVGRRRKKFLDAAQG